MRTCAPAAPASAIAGASWSALGTSVDLRVNDPAALSCARARVECELDVIDRVCSRFRPDSELSHLNARAGRVVRVSPLLLEAVELAIDAARTTDGDVDPTVGRALELAGYDRDWRELPEPCGEPFPQTITIRARAGWQAIAVDRVASTVRTPAGVRIDLGATAKAWAADRAAAAAGAATDRGVLVSLGGDVAVSGPAPVGDWPIRVTDDHRSGPSAPGQSITIRSGGLATSSTAVRRWSHRGHTMHHIIDPATGAPALGAWRTVSVAAVNCAQANVAATAAIVRGRSAIEWLTARGLPARLVDRDGAVTRIGDWPAPVNPHSRRPRRAGRWAMSAVMAASGGSAYWYLTRSTGAVALLLLTFAIVLGVVDVRRWSTPEWPRFVLDTLHRNMSLLAMVFLGLHVLTAVLDSFAPISFVDAFVPFAGSYRPLWLGLGAIALDLLIAVTVTSMLRQRVGFASWRAIHWLTYASWPVALLHGLGTGSDVTSTWLLALSIACLAAVLGAVLVRVVGGWPEHLRRRGAALAGAGLFSLFLLLWLPAGPLGSEWARRSGTPGALLAHSHHNTTTRGPKQ